MKRFIAFIAVSCFILSLLHSQIVPLLDQERRHEVAISVQDVLDLGQNGLHVSYRYHLKRGALRLALRLGDYEFSGVPSRPGTIQSRTQYLINPGIEKNKWLGKHWMLSGSAGPIVSWNHVEELTYDANYSQTNPRLISNIRSLGMGLGGRINIRYQMTSRVSFGSELLVSFQRITGKKASSYEGVRYEERVLDTYTLLDMDIPTGVYLQFLL
ncbi:MAG: hypothetical protein R3B47_11060 [Bacteroidia bacterium]